MLTTKEKKVFCGLVKYPMLNDRELAEKINISRSTITAIRNRLKKEDYFITVKLPNFERIGCEVLTILYGEFHPRADYSNGAKFASDMVSKLANIFFMATLYENHVSFGAADHITQVKEHIESTHRVHMSLGYEARKKHTYIIFPFKLTRIFKFFDYSHLVCTYFNNTDVDKIPVDFDITASKPISMSDTEKKVFYMMIEHPDLNEIQIAKKVSMTRQSISAMRKKFEAAELMKTIRIPSIKKMGFEIMVFAHFHINSQVRAEERKEAITMLMENPSTILKISGNLEAVVLSVFRNYTEYQQEYNRMLSFYRRRNYLLGDPEIKIFSVEDMGHPIYHSYGGIVKSAMHI